MTAAHDTGPGGFDAVVLAGGGARRLDGIDKAGVEVGGRRLLDRVLDAVGHAERVVVVGPGRPGYRPVTWTREEPSGSGPAAAVAAGLRLVTAPAVVVLAADLPFLDGASVDALRRATPPGGGAVLVDHDGVEQLLAGCWSTVALRDAVARVTAARGDLVDCSVRRLVQGLPLQPVRPDGAPAWLDCDTSEDVRRARELA